MGKPSVIPNKGASVGRHDWKPGDDHNYKIEVTETGLLLTPMARPYIELMPGDAVYLAELLLRHVRMQELRESKNES